MLHFVQHGPAHEPQPLLARVGATGVAGVRAGGRHSIKELANVARRLRGIKVAVHDKTQHRTKEQRVDLGRKHHHHFAGTAQLGIHGQGITKVRQKNRPHHVVELLPEGGVVGVHFARECRQAVGHGGRVLDNDGVRPHVCRTDIHRYVGHAKINGVEIRQFERCDGAERTEGRPRGGRRHRV